MVNKYRSVKSKLFDKTNDCNFTLVFIEPITATIAEEENVPHITNIQNGVLAKPTHLDTLLTILAKELKFQKCEKDEVFFKNDYMIKRNVNIKLSSILSIDTFNHILFHLSKLLSSHCDTKFIVEIPFNIISRLDKCRLEKHARVSIGHLSIGSLVNLSKYYVHFKVPRDLASTKHLPMMVKMKFVQQNMTIRFHLDTQATLYELFYTFASFRTIVVERHDTYDRIYFACTDAPLLCFASLTKEECETGVYDDIPFDRWKRTVQFPSSSYSDRLSTNDVTLLGMSKTFCIEVHHNEEESPFLNQLIHIAHICRERNHSFQLYLSILRHIECRHVYADLSRLLTLFQLPFTIHFACLVLFSSSYAVFDALRDEKLFITFLVAIKNNIEQFPEPEQLACLEQCIYHLKVQIKECPLINVYEEFRKLLHFKEKYTPEVLPDNYVLIRRATLYPSHLEFSQPVPLLKSRFTNLANEDYSIRLTVLDDNGRVLNKCKTNEFEFLMNIHRTILLDGVEIGNRKYKFLGSSTSQMRDNGCTLYAQDPEGRDVNDIRNAAGKLGVFSRNVSKYIARFGLIFSQARTSIEIDRNDVNIMLIDDILGEVKPNINNRNCGHTNWKKERHILSDGIGIVARSVAELFQPALQLSTDYFPSAYQIRFGGCKGMLVVWDMPEHSILFRNSMKKYHSDCRMLGILNFSLPRSVFLNRPLINILDHLQVCRDQFYRYFHHSTASVAKATLYDSCAMDLIRIYSSGLLPYESILNAGISLLDEPFLRSIINYLISYRLNFELKKKARIRVPNDSGRITFGVLDETKTLEYGEIYFQYTRLNEEGGLLGETVILEGEVMITKFPCQQPGDVRKFKAVKVDGLSHIKDCLVFPANGQRSHPDEMGGSDLDGDEYAIFWDTLKFPGNNNQPMDFPYGLSRKQRHDITNEDLVDFFCTYLMKNNIGEVANKHLMLSDYLPDGLNSEECQDLAYLYQVSLDYSKTGVIRRIPRNPRYFLPFRPDFMERNMHENVYLSGKILGEFYRHCTLVERAIELSQGESQLNRNKEFNLNDPNLSLANKLILKGWRKFYTPAEEAFIDYTVRMVAILEQLEVPGVTEVMLFADMYENKNCKITKPLLKQLFGHFKDKFEKQCQQNCGQSIDRLYLASAWYAICYEKCFEYNGKQLFGLPWIVAEEMCQLAQFSFSRKVATDAILAMNMRTMIDQYGERITVSIGMNHKQVVLYKPEGELFCDTLFDYQTKTVYNTEVVHFYWCPFVVVQAFNRHYPHLLALHHQLIDEIQLKIVLELVIKWIGLINKKIYYDKVENRLIRLFDRQSATSQCDDSSIDFFEKHLLPRIISKQLRQMHEGCGRKANRLTESLPTVSTLFNRFMLYLFEICNTVNSAIYHARMEELFLLKYAIFALGFVNKLDHKLDRHMYNSFSLNMRTDHHWGGHVFVLQQIYDGIIAGEGVRQLEHLFPDVFDAASNVYHKTLDSVFDAYLVENALLVNDTCKFNLLSTASNVNLREAPPSLLSKLYYLTGLETIELLSDEDTEAIMPDNHQQVQTAGLLHSTQILRLLIGHPFFMENICCRFDVNNSCESNHSNGNEPKAKTMKCSSPVFDV